MMRLSSSRPSLEDRIIDKLDREMLRYLMTSHPAMASSTCHLADKIHASSLLTKYHHRQIILLLNVTSDVLYLFLFSIFYILYYMFSLMFVRFRTSLLDHHGSDPGLLLLCVMQAETLPIHFVWSFLWDLSSCKVLNHKTQFHSIC